MISNKKWSRRDFLAFISATGITPMTLSCIKKPNPKPNKNSAIAELKGPILNDDVILSPGLHYKLVIKEGDPIGPKMTFGTNNDYLNFYTFKDGRTALWCNHENVYPPLAHNRKMTEKPTPEQLDFEREMVGGSFIEVTKNDKGHWSYVKDSDLNFKISGNTPIKLSKTIESKSVALGTLANCSGGFTPWGTILTCEENYHHFYGEREGQDIKISKDYDLKWLEVDPKPTEHYGWVVEIDPVKKSAEKLISLGRFSHECATVVVDSKGYPVVYSGDDAKDECLYKFVSKSKTHLKEGTLYAANLETGKWLSLDYESSELLKKNFKDQTDVLINCRKAAKLLGATPLDRPEDIEQDPITKDIFVTLTNNKPKGNYHGSILKISEKNKSDLQFKHSTFRAGGTETGFSCPDNMAFDQNGNLWITSDISGGSIGKDPYTNFGHNGLFVVPRSGKQAGQVLKVGSAPVDAEFTGPYFSDDQKTLFLSVQHPGEKTKDLSRMTSHWPSKDKSKKPLSSVIAIQGSLLDSLTKKA